MSIQASDFSTSAKEIYRERLQEELERSHPGAYVAIEPISGEHFLGETLSEAIQASRRTYPERLCYAIRVGFRTAAHLGLNHSGTMQS